MTTMKDKLFDSFEQMLGLVISDSPEFKTVLTSEIQTSSLSANNFNFAIDSGLNLMGKY